jgi:hypothetical protein
MATKIRVNLGNGATAEFASVDLIPIELHGLPYDVIEIVEPKPEETAAACTPLYIEKITNLVDHLITRALSSSIGKQGSRSYLESQRIIYQEKYDVAKGIVVNENMVQTITDEMNRDYPNDEDLDAVLISYGITPTGTKLEKFFQFIIFRFEYGLAGYKFFLSLVEDFRTCTLTHVEQYNFDKCDTIISMVENLPVQISQQQLVDLREQMLAV